ncbi:transglutaminase domain-containing protein [bacterium]|nr:transglutaminase domain-containing protein [bacterium]RQV97453.1 MAG: hypothetical protein EH221_03685 [bacterium]
MKRLGTIGLLLLFILPCYAENYLLNGGQSSRIDYTMVQTIVPSTGVKNLIVSYVVPQTYRSPSYNQTVEHFHLTFSSEPQKRENKTDTRGNEIIKVTWINPRSSINATIQLRTTNFTTLQPLVIEAPFPVQSLSSDVRVYLAATKQVPADDPDVVRIAQLLTSSSKTQFDAVQKILTWIVDNMNYVLRPKQYDAIYSIVTSRGNCQNYSHLAAALMRAAGIPVRIINGLTLKEPYQVKFQSGIFTMRMGQGRHSWIEVYFSDLGWVPFDPQQMQLFVSNRFIRVEVGLDNEETVNDGTVMWTRYSGTSGTIQFQETIDVNFTSDEVNLSAERQQYGPRKLLFSPPVEALFTEEIFKPSEAAPATTIRSLDAYTYDEETIFGNLEFPEGIDFTNVRNQVEDTEDSMMVMRKNFLVETSEYVTTQGQKYAQTFIAEDPLQLEKIGLALHKFGGNGQLWIELSEDDGTGKPGNIIATSGLRLLENMDYSPGYSWVDFDFTQQNLIFSPGRYWLALAYTGSPVVNWFFTYGKPVGPTDGTRYNTLFDETWSHSLTYEFNYRIMGKKGR